MKDRLLVSTSSDWSVRMWSAQFGDFIKKFEGGHEHMVSCLKWLDGLGKPDLSLVLIQSRFDSISEIESRFDPVSV